MGRLQLKYLGEFAVLRDGQSLKLPPSRKTRALLAYLSLNQRRFRRDFLCEMLWELPDDPRGSLRWSLSKLRRLIDDDDKPRIIADRTYVELDSSNIEIDAADLRALAGNSMTGATIEALQDAAKRFRGNFLEGLDLPNFHDFHAWCIAEREEINRAQVSVLTELVCRFGDAPHKALPYARSLVAMSPYDEMLRASLIELLVSLNYRDEAEQQFQLGLRMLKEVGAVPTGAMNAARKKRPTAERPARVEKSDAPTPSRVASIELSSGLVGRTREAETLIRIFKEAAEKGTAHFAMIRGEPGIGKTRLIEAASAYASGTGASVLNAGAYESESIRPFALWIDALHRFDARKSEEIFGGEEAGNRDRLFDRLSQFIDIESGKKPLVLIFDDLHWCDESSAAAIHYVARMNRDRPVYGILAARDGEMPDNVAAQQAIRGLKHDGLLTEIYLGPLPKKDLVVLIGERAPGVSAEKLSRQCGGNPLMAIELARAEQEGDSSTSVSELVGERLARFSIEGAEVLQWAAVLNPHIDEKMIADLTGFDAAVVVEKLEQAERQGMLTVMSDGLRFSHDLLARAVYTTLSPMRRQVMHRRIAERLEESTALDLGRAADLAHHATQSGDAGLAARATVSAGRLCLRFYANDDALNLVRRGVQLVDQLTDPERVCVLIDLEDVRLAAGPLEDWESSAREYADLAELALDHGKLGHARLGYHMAATVRWAHGQWAYARQESLQSERVVRSGSDGEQIIGMAETAKCLVMIERDLFKADAMLMEAQALASRNGISHFAIPLGLGMLRFHEDKLDDAVELLMEARALCKSVGARIDEFQTNEQLAMIEIQRSNYQAARDYCAILEKIGQKLRVGSEGPFAQAMSALCDYAINDDGKPLEDTLGRLRAVDAKYRLAYTLSRAAQIDCDRGRLEKAAQRATEALNYATLLQRATEMVLARAILLCTSRAQGDSAAAAEHEAAIAELEKSGVADWASAWVRREAGEKRNASS